MPPATKPLQWHIQRAIADLSRNIDVVDSCWIWKRAINKDGYPVATIAKKSHRMNRFVAKYVKGLDIEGLFVCHSCDNPLCVNPDHLWAGTHKQNMEDMVAKKRSNCVNKKAIMTPAGQFASMKLAQQHYKISRDVLKRYMKDDCKNYYFVKETDCGAQH